MPTPVTVMGVIFYKKQYLALQRAPARGGFWQPLTGTQERGEDDHTTLVRELQEELGIGSHDIEKLFFAEEHEFFDQHDNPHKERSYGVQLRHHITPRLSDEHEQHKWVSKSAFLKILKFPGNRKALRTVAELSDSTHREKK